MNNIKLKSLSDDEFIRRLSLDIISVCYMIGTSRVEMMSKGRIQLDWVADRVKPWFMVHGLWFMV